MSRYPTLLISLCAGLLVACGKDAGRPTHEFQGQAMGTSFHIAVVDPPPHLQLAQLQSRLQDKLEHIENIASTYRDSSELAKFNFDPSTDWITTSNELCMMVSSAVAIGRETAGAFDITVGPVVDLWGFGPGEIKNTPPSDADIESARGATGLDKLDVDCDQSRIRKSVASLRLDLSAWAKGYAVDQLATVLDATGQENYLVELGGELKVRGHNAADQPFAIAIENPASRTLGNFTIIRVSNTGVATSGDYRNYFEYDGIRYSHTIDPTTGRPVAHTLSAVTVIHASTAYADATATALLVLGPDDALNFANAHAIAALFAVATPNGLNYVSSEAFENGEFLSN